jgi:O-antigen/teichoic acid export membrane protein
LSGEPPAEGWTTREDVRRKAVSGIRAVLILNVATIPLSFVTNLVLGRTSSTALGTYSAIVVFTEAFQSCLLLGGANVFTRFVPSLPPPRRWSFLATYFAIVAGGAAVVLAVAALLFPELSHRLLGMFGGPPLRVALALCGAVLVWAFSSFFLYGDLDAAGAAMTLRAIVVGFFVVVVIGAGLARETLAADPVAFLWPAAVVVYGAAAVFGAWRILRGDAFAKREPIRWGLPQDFWSAALFTHLQTLAAFAYTSLAPLVVLVWLDVTALGFLHAALRFPVLVGAAPVMMASVIGPAVSAHLAAGRDAEAMRQVRRALDGAWLAVVPASLALAAAAQPAMRLYGAGYPEHRDLLRILAPSAIAAPMVFIGASVAVARHAFGAYFASSLLFLVATLSASAWLVPRFGLAGAAFAATAGAFVQHVAVETLLARRFSFARPARGWWGWGWAAALSAALVVLDPGIVASAALGLVAVVGFAATARLSPGEVQDALRKLRGTG